MSYIFSSQSSPANRWFQGEKASGFGPAHLYSLLKSKLEELGYPSAEFGAHNLRAGGRGYSSCGKRCVRQAV